MLFAGNCSCRIPVNRGESIAWRPHACFALSASQAADDGCHFGPVADVEHFGRMDRIATFAYERHLAVCSTQEQLLVLLPSVSEQM